MQHQLMEILTQYGYAGLYLLLALSMIGLPVPDQTIMTLFGYWSSLGHASLPAAWIFSWSGTMTGMLASYWIGKRFGRPFLERYGKWLFLTPLHLLRAEKWLHKYGVWTAAFGYFIPGVRHFTSYLSGAGKLKGWKYVIFAGSGAAFWSAIFLNLGYHFGENWGMLSASLEKLIVLLILLAIFAALLILLFIRKKKPSGMDG